ncbi:hypothetical protein BDM02DRAFT_3135470 [Thelephora ganbajun]|uniref:Uncharacterized protein n=1 Tax=Thelephora ganbajun TaxID=370292 RepID=A0ACB6ZW24_THEGA|nr:hypothetical protein BDM02DRAFT_3135470 [Thelephora ganbajun]
MISSGIRGGAEEANKFLISTRLFTLAESLGSVESIVEVPAQMTHGSVPPAEGGLLGIGDNLFEFGRINRVVRVTVETSISLIPTAKELDSEQGMDKDKYKDE